MDGWFFKTNLVCSPPSENIDNGWMMMMMNDDDDDNDDSSFLPRVLMENGNKWNSLTAFYITNK